jgi:acyl carrier protein
MTDASIFEKLTCLLREVFDRDDIVATPDLTAQRVDGWDSLGNVRLFVEIERAFSIRFSATEIGSLKNVGQLAELIGRKTHSGVP